MATDMRKWFNEELKKISDDFTGSIINVGCGDDKDNEGGCYKDYFKNAIEYKTCDGNINVKVDFTSLESIPDNSFDTVLNFWVLEHVWNFELFLYQLKLITKKNLIIAVPTKYNYHPAPNDYWRFTKESIRILLEQDFNIITMKEYDNNADQGGILIKAEVK